MPDRERAFEFYVQMASKQTMGVPSEIKGHVTHSKKYLGLNVRFMHLYSITQFKKIK